MFVVFGVDALALRRQPFRSQGQSSLPQPCQLCVYLIPLERNLMRLALLGPEVRDGEPRVHVRAEIVHDANREHNVHSKPEDLQVAAFDQMGEVTHVTHVGDDTFEVERGSRSLDKHVGWIVGV